MTTTLFSLWRQVSQHVRIYVCHGCGAYHASDVWNLSILCVLRLFLCGARFKALSKPGGARFYKGIRIVHVDDRLRYVCCIAVVLFEFRTVSF